MEAVLRCNAEAALDVLLAERQQDARQVQQLREALEERNDALRMIRDAWNGHMAVCLAFSALPDLEAPSWKDIERWRNAPSDTASGTLVRDQTCPVCNGTGKDPRGGGCFACGGSGKVAARAALARDPSQGRNQP
jgi:hypothetical protein